MQAAVFHESYNLELADYPMPKMGSADLRIQVEACGVCGTDRHIYSGEAPSKPPLILGHEYVGSIVEVGSDVLGFNVGDKVAVDPNIRCEHCDFCKKGQVNLCANLRALGVTMNGGFAEYSVFPANQAYPIPKEFPSKFAAFAEPLSCCLRGIQQASIAFNDAVVIVGGGTIGLLMLQLSLLRGASKTALIEPIHEKRAIARELLADEVFDPKEDQLVAQICDMTSGGADVVIECVGSVQAAELSLKLARRGGKIVMFGQASKGATVSLNLQQIFSGELTIMGSLHNPFTFQTAVNLIVSGKVRIDLLNPIPMSLENLPGLLNGSNSSSAIKHQISPNSLI